MSRPVGQGGDVYAAVAHPVRRRVLKMLGKSDLTAGEIVRRFKMSQPAVAQHLRILREAKLVTQRRDGVRRIYRLNRGPVRKMLTFLRELDV